MKPSRRACFLLSLFSLLAIPAPSWAAEVIGRAVNAQGAPLRSVEVRLGPLVTRTDGEGRFVFRNVAPGVYDMSCGGAAQRVSVRDGVNQLACRGG